MALPYLEAQAKNGAGTPYVVHLLLDEAVPLDRDALVKGLEARLGRVEPAENASATLHFSLPEYVARIGEARMPFQLAVLALDGISVDELGAALRQSWTWSGASEIAARCRASLTLADFFGAGLDRRIRLALFHGAMSTLLELLPIRAIQWMPSQQVISPGAYVEQLQRGEGLRGSAINVRKFRINTAEGPVHLIDTMGLHAFGLPDLQCRYVDEDTARMRALLLDRAAALFDEGESFIARGAVTGLGEGDEWPFVPATSSAEPKRPVLDLSPSSPRTSAG